MNSETLANEIAEFALEKKGKQIAIMNLNQITTVADYFVIISGDSDTQIRAIADHIIKKLKDKKIKIYHKEGYENLRIYKENKTFSLWGKNCTACFSEEQLLKRGGGE